jgi:hypothetical protein
MRALADVDRSSQALLANRVTKIYGDGTTALNELELRIPAGCFFGLLGPALAGELGPPLFDPASTILSFCAVDVPYFFFWLNVILLRLSGPS